MTNYYIIQMQAFDEIDKRLKQTLESGSNINIPLFILDFSRQWPLSPKTINKRIELYVRANAETMEIINNEVKLI